MSHILQPFGATNIGFDAHITNSHNFWVTKITHLHCTKIPCFVHCKQPFHRNNMVRGYRINNPLNIIITNMLALLLFNKEYHNILNNHSNYSVFLIIILFIFTFKILFFIPMPTISSYMTFFPTIKAFSSFLKLRSISWLWLTIEFSIIRSSASTSTFVLCDKSFILCIVYIHISPTNFFT